MRTRTFLEPTSHGVDSYVTTQTEHPYLTLKISDCSEVISLEFNVNTGQGRTTARNKLRKLQAALDGIGAAIEKAAE